MIRTATTAKKENKRDGGKGWARRGFLVWGREGRKEDSEETGIGFVEIAM